LILIYSARNKINEKVYVGQTAYSLRERIRHHLYEATKRNTNLKFSGAIKRYGIAAFEFKVIGRAKNSVEADRLERFFIRVLKTQNDLFGYNVASGGKVSRGYKKTYKQKKHLFGNQYGKGNVCSKAQRIKTSKRIKRWWREHPEAKKRLGAYAHKRLLGNTIWVGRKHSAATKKKLSKIRRLSWIQKKAA
jgi:group I intron endonuclease